MKNIFKLSILGLGLALTLASCSPEDPIGSKVTYYPLITVNGDDFMSVEEGGTFNDPGAVATIGDEEVPVTTTYEGRFRGQTYNSTLGTSVADLYTASYAATNEDGFDGVATRTIYVGNTGDLVTSIEGLYRSTVTRNGALTAQYTDMEYVLIWKNSDGTYEISDAFGGYYDLGRAYGVGYITPGGVIVANDIPTNNFSFPGTQYNSGFGAPSEITAMTVDPATNSIDLTVVWTTTTTYTFQIHLDQVQL
ncbi:BT_2262 family domain-containing protein [Flavobacterium sp. RHBU_3]|uniref:BT_2262 family domain-containing protein n=1 Tax=Flavobacterium sp. RHBU_3 TaxID=3391184 RepID=UPI00398510B8